MIVRNSFFRSEHWKSIMNRFPQRSGQFSPRDASGMFIPPPPIPPWAVQTNFPPPPLPPPMLPVPAPLSLPTNVPVPLFPPNAFHGPPMIRPNIPPRQPSEEGSMWTPPQEGDGGKCSENQSEVDKWLRMRRIDPYRITKTKPKTEIQICVVREKLNEVFRMMRDLENGARTLTVMVKTVTEAEWEQKCREIEVKKKQLTELLAELELSEQDLSVFKDKQVKRKKKRERLRRQKERWRKVKEEEKVLTQNRHVQLDNWLREMQEGVERVQREEEMKREADAVLWSITQKKTESRRQASLLSALLELRQVRVKRLTAAGKPFSETQVFNTVIEGLQKLWQKHLQDIAEEEQVLRGMLTQPAVSEDVLNTHKKLVLQQWELAIFGVLGCLDSGPKGGDLEDVRWNWDQYVASEHTPLSSTIPPGWVLPVPPSTDEWQKILKY